MAKVWLVMHGPDPTRGEPFRHLPLSECQEKLGLNPSNWVSDSGRGPRFGNPADELARFRGPQHVVVEIDLDEAKAHGWRPGFYVPNITPDEAARRCGVTAT